ncbi:MAG: hypothetical protein HY231_25665 [Acidobacteria bacterium]|nr:hypothetical protein [Acidobacteriota bacterium]
MLNKDFLEMLSAFCEAKVEFMLVGSYAFEVKEKALMLSPIANLEKLVRRISQELRALKTGIESLPTTTKKLPLKKKQQG